MAAEQRGPPFLLAALVLAAMLGGGYILGRWFASTPEPPVASPEPAPARTSIPRPVGSATAPEAAPARVPSFAVPGPPSATPEEPTNPAPTAPPERIPSSAFPKAIREVVEAHVKGNIEECLDEWAEEAPGISGKVTLEFQLDGTGLADVAILDHTDVPLGPLSCFSSAIWSAPWPAPESGDVKITYPFQFDTPGSPAEE